MEIEKSKLYISFLHGRYGSWKYTFRYQNADFELIGYDSLSLQHNKTDSEKSINFSTGQKIEKRNTNWDPDEPEVFEITKGRVNNSKLLRLSEIKDFNDLHLSEL